jgi:hypothetical protein
LVVVVVAAGFVVAGVVLAGFVVAGVVLAGALVGVALVGVPGAVVGGTFSFWPARMRLAFVMPLTVMRSCMLTPSFLAIPLNVSPETTVYSVAAAEVGGVVAAVVATVVVVAGAVVAAVVAAVAMVVVVFGLLSSPQAPSASPPTTAVKIPAVRHHVPTRLPSRPARRRAPSPEGTPL